MDERAAVGSGSGSGYVRLGNYLVSFKQQNMPEWHIFYAAVGC